VWWWWVGDEWCTPYAGNGGELRDDISNNEEGFCRPVYLQE